MTDRVESMQVDVDELRTLRQRVKELEAALSDARNSVITWLGTARRG